MIEGLAPLDAPPRDYADDEPESPLQIMAGAAITGAFVLGLLIGLLL